MMMAGQGFGKEELPKAQTAAIGRVGEQVQCRSELGIFQRLRRQRR